MDTQQKMDFLELPYLAMANVLKHVEPIDILNLSLCSKTSEKVMSKFYKRNSAQVNIVYISPALSFVNMKFDGHRTIQFRFENELPTGGTPMELTLFGFKFDAVKTVRTHIAFNCTDDNLYVKLPNVVHFLRSLFDSPMQLVIEPNVAGLQQLIEHPCFKNIAELYISPGYQGRPINAEQFNHILDKVNVTRKFGISSAIVPTKKIPQVFTVKDFFLHNATWMDGSDLLKLNVCETALFRQSNFTTDDIEAMVNKWKTQKETPVLKQLAFQWNPDVNVALKKVAFSRWDSSKRSKRCRTREESDFTTYDCSQAMDIEREDGLLASLGLVEEETGTLLLFHVWHERFPTKTTEENLLKRKDELYKEQVEINEKHGTPSEGQMRLSNPELTYSQFQELLTGVYENRLEEEGHNENVETWFNFQVNILNVLKDIEMYF